MKVVVKLPYPHRFLGVTISLNKEVGFLFTNLATFQFRENLNINTSDEYKKWLAENGESRMISEMMYGAAQAYCLDQRKKQRFTKSKLVAAIASASSEVQKQIVDCWRKSQTFGVVESKKKTVKKRA